MTLGTVPVIPYGSPRRPSWPTTWATRSATAQALLMANHGALTVGDSLYRAWERMETLEQLARVALVTRLLGHDRLLAGATWRACELRAPRRLSAARLRARRRAAARRAGDAASRPTGPVTLTPARAGAPGRRTRSSGFGSAERGRA